MRHLTRVCTLLLLAASPFHAPAEQHKDEEAENMGFRTVNVDWGKLVFISRAITKVRFEIFDTAHVHGENQRSPTHALLDKQGLDYETQERRVVEGMNTMLHVPLRVAVPDDQELLGSERLYVLGRITIVTNEDEFTVGVSTEGFFLGKDEPEARNRFYSWGLAKTLDRILMEQRKTNVPPKVFRVLSGEAAIDADKAVYDEIWKGSDAKPH